MVYISPWHRQCRDERKDGMGDYMNERDRYVRDQLAPLINAEILEPLMNLFAWGVLEEAEGAKTLANHLNIDKLDCHAVLGNDVEFEELLDEMNEEAAVNSYG